MKIYTKTGDKGQSSLYNGSRTAKTDPVFHTLGEIDTLNAKIGHLTSFLTLDHPFCSELQKIQKKLLSLSAEIAKAEQVRNQVTETDTTFLEERIDFMSAATKPLKNLILPGGSPAGSFTHIVRTQARTVERTFLHLQDKPANQAIGPFLNRLSDYFFALARYVNEQDGQTEPEWK